MSPGATPCVPIRLKSAPPSLLGLHARSRHEIEPMHRRITQLPYQLAQLSLMLSELDGRPAAYLTHAKPILQHKPHLG